MKNWSEPSGKSESVTEEVLTDDPAVDDPGADDLATDDLAGDDLEELDDADLTRVLEALLLVVDTPVPVETLASATEQPVYRISDALRRMAEDLTARGSGIDLREMGGGWRMYTRARFAPYVERLLLDGSRSKLTRAALETLAVVAYRQPVTRARVSAVRGVNVDAVIRTLVQHPETSYADDVKYTKAVIGRQAGPVVLVGHSYGGAVITEAGNDSDTGATMFATTELFLERLGLASLNELPDIAPLLPDVDVIDDLSESLDSEPRFAKLSRAPQADMPVSLDVDTDV